jgi:ribonuclease HI
MGKIAGNEGNERCDELATKAALDKKLEVDEVYERLKEK